MSALRWVVGVLLIPPCVAVSLTVRSLLLAGASAAQGGVPASALWMAGGFAAWVLAYVALPRPVRCYVVAHELTHALWAALTGVRVLGMRLSKEEGSVAVSESNFLIALAPYFFPLYTMLAILLYYGLMLFLDVESYENLWMAIVGFTWGFHVTFTARTLLRRQSDIQAYGRLFSFAVIYLFNALGMALWIVMVSRATLEQMVSALAGHTVTLLVGAWSWILERLLSLLHNKGAV